MMNALSMIHNIRYIRYIRYQLNAFTYVDVLAFGSASAFESGKESLISRIVTYTITNISSA